LLITTAGKKVLVDPFFREFEKPTEIDIKKFLNPDYIGPGITPCPFNDHFWNVEEIVRMI